VAAPRLRVMNLVATVSLLLGVATGLRGTFRRRIELSRHWEEDRRVHRREPSPLTKPPK
jgi:hypothetical protein